MMRPSLRILLLLLALAAPGCVASSVCVNDQAPADPVARTVNQGDADQGMPKADAEAAR